MKLDAFNAANDWCKKNKFEVKAFAEITSTNDLAKKEAFDVDGTAIYIARKQTQGRGRGKNTWENAKAGSQLLATWSFSVASPPQIVTAPIIGLAVFNALKKVFPSERLAIKAPNDIYLNDKKVAGLLVESVSKGDSHRLLVGVGINIWDAPSNVPLAGSLKNIKEFSPAQFEEILDQINHGLNQARHDCLSTHLTESQRSGLIAALNAFKNLKEPYQTISPFGDLVTHTSHKSWREL